ncbi:MAG: arginine--tRNA ligase [Candidatus Bathyarchaeota archaeon]|nr:arginine--tRNA ligase [Candidatus Bathyarchaeota archaeon]
MTLNPFYEFREQCKQALKNALIKLYEKEIKDVPLILEIPPSREFGELATTICFEISKRSGAKPFEIASVIAKEIDLHDFTLIDSTKNLKGYLNFSLNYPEFVKLTLNSIRELNENYGFVKSDQVNKIIVEHSSFNPIHAIHVGQARSPILGDALFRMLKNRGHEVSRHFYIDDTGRQSAIIAYGYELLGLPKPPIKPDHFMGQIYSIMNCLLEIKKLQEKIEEPEDTDNISEIKQKLNEWVDISEELKTKHSKLFSKLEKKMSAEKEQELKLNRFLKNYEEKESTYEQLIRKVTNLCLKGFSETLNKLGIEFDSWDWESDLIWSGDVKEVIQKLQDTEFVLTENGVLKLDAERLVNELDLRELLCISKDYEIPSVSLTRSDGTSLYVTRDIAYSLHKFKLAENVINVIGSEQKLAQLHVKIALCALGKKKFATKQHHFAFGLVELPQYKMSSRRGRIIALDKIIDEAIKIAHEKVSEQHRSISKKEEENIAKCIGLNAIKYALLSVEPSKNVTFTWDRVLDFKRNSAPFINYASTRIQGILRKVGTVPDEIKYELLKENLEKEIILYLSRFPEIFIDSCDNLRPDAIANYANLLSERFHEYYEKVDISHVDDEGLKFARSALISSIQIVLNNAMNTLGIEMTEKM